MINISQLFLKIDSVLQICYTFAALKSKLLAIVIANGLIQKPIFHINDNTPPRLTSVAHLGGFSFYIGL